MKIKGRYYTTIYITVSKFKREMNVNINTYK